MIPIERIPQNYVDSSRFIYSSYRQYQRTNNRFMNLVEAHPVVMMKVRKEQKKLQATEAVAVTQFRRSKLFRNPANSSQEGNLADLLKENPVYHIEKSCLASRKLHEYQFWFDTSIKSDAYYVVNYISPRYSSETHGISNYNEKYFYGESWEKGTMYIDRNSFAFIKMQRAAFRFPEYSYYNKPNFLNDIKYMVEFVSAQLDAEYGSVGDRWQIKKLNYQYTNDFVKGFWGSKDYTITEAYEWTADSTSRYISEEFADKFYEKLAGRVYNYNKDKWLPVKAPFYFYKQDSVYNDLEKSGNIEGQFYNESINRDN